MSRIHNVPPGRRGGYLREFSERLDQEDDEGSVEYKWRLVGVGATRLQHLITQMQFRVGEGGGECIYEIGVEDNGIPRGLCDDDYDESLATLRRMADTLEFTCSVAFERVVADCPRLRCAEVRVCDSRARVTPFKVAVLGAEHAGKTSLVASLARGIADDGSGLARQHILRHRHEFVSGHTSDCATALIGFNRDGTLLAGWHEAHDDAGECSDSAIMKASATVVQLLDTPGLRKYERTKWAALMSRQPSHVVVVVRVDSDSNFEPHVDAAVAMGRPFTVVLTHHDRVSCGRQMASHVARVSSYITSRCSDVDVEFVSVHDSTTDEDDDDDLFIDVDSPRTPPGKKRAIRMFCVSNVSLFGISNLRQHLFETASQSAKEGHSPSDQETVALVHKFISRYGMPIALCTVLSGTVRVGNSYTLGRVAEGVETAPVTVESIQVFGLFTDTASPGCDAAFALGGQGSDWDLLPTQRRGCCGMVLADRLHAPEFVSELGFQIAQITAEAQGTNVAEGEHATLLTGNSRFPVKLCNGERSLIALCSWKDKRPIVASGGILLRDGRQPLRVTFLRNGTARSISPESAFAPSQDASNSSVVADVRNSSASESIPYDGLGERINRPTRGEKRRVASHQRRERSRDEM